jgi:proteic killer suppression protein
MIKTFLHKGLELYFRTGSKRGIAPAHATRLRLQLARLNSAQVPQDMNLPGWRLHPLRGDLREHWAVWVDKSWRLTFRFEGTDAVLVNYQDYH